MYAIPGNGVCEKKTSSSSQQSMDPLYMYRSEELVRILLECDRREVVSQRGGAATIEEPPCAKEDCVVERAREEDADGDWPESVVCDDGTILVREEGRYVDPTSGEAHFPHRCFRCEKCKNGKKRCARIEGCEKRVEGVSCCFVGLKKKCKD